MYKIYHDYNMYGKCIVEGLSVPRFVSRRALRVAAAVLLIYLLIINIAATLYTRNVLDYDVNKYRTIGLNVSVMFDIISVYVGPFEVIKCFISYSLKLLIFLRIYYIISFVYG